MSGIGAHRKQVPRKSAIYYGPSHRGWSEGEDSQQWKILSANADFLELQRLAVAAERKGEYTDAANFLQRAVTLAISTDSEYTKTDRSYDWHFERLVSFCDRAATQCIVAGKHNHALVLLKKAEKLTNSDARIDGDSFEGKLRAALQYLERAARMEAKYKEADNPGATLLNLGTIHTYLGNHQEATVHLNDALKIFVDEGNEAEQKGSTYSMEQKSLIASSVAITMHNIAVNFHNLNQPRQALEWHKKAEHCLVTVNSDHDEKWSLSNRILDALEDAQTAHKNLVGVDGAAPSGNTAGRILSSPEHLLPRLASSSPEDDIDDLDIEEERVQKQPVPPSKPRRASSAGTTPRIPVGPSGPPSPSKAKRPVSAGVMWHPNLVDKKRHLLGEILQDINESSEIRESDLQGGGEARREEHKPSRPTSRAASRNSDARPVSRASSRPGSSRPQSRMSVRSRPSTARSSRSARSLAQSSYVTDKMANNRKKAWVSDWGQRLANERMENIFTEAKENRSIFANERPGEQGRNREFVPSEGIHTDNPKVNRLAASVSKMGPFGGLDANGNRSIIGLHGPRPRTASAVMASPRTKPSKESLKRRGSDLGMGDTSPKKARGGIASGSVGDVGDEFFAEIERRCVAVEAEVGMALDGGIDEETQEVLNVLRGAQETEINMLRTNNFGTSPTKDIRAVGLSEYSKPSRHVTLSKCMDKETLAVEEVAATIIQARWRGFMVRSNVERFLVPSEIIKEAITRDEAIKFVVQKRREDRRNQQARFLQAWMTFRLYYIKSGQKKARDKAAMCPRIQKAWRGYWVRKQKAILSNAATVIQCWWRRYLARVYVRTAANAEYRIRQCLLRYAGRYQRWAHRSRVIKVQAFVRGRAVRRHVGQVYSSTRVLQSWIRNIWAQRRVTYLRSSANVLQSSRMMWGINGNLEKFVRSQRVISRYWRGHLVRLRVERMVAGAYLIQGSWKKYHGTRRLRRRVASAVKIQTWFRLLFYYNVMRRRNRMARLIQSAVKGYMNRKKRAASHRVLLDFQETWARGAAGRGRVKHLHKSARVIQSSLRRYWWRRDNQAIVLGLQECGPMTQLTGIARGYLARLRRRRAERAAMQIQGWFLRRRQRKQYLEYKKAITGLQAMWRRYKDIDEKRMWMFYRALENRAKDEAVVLRVQAAARGFLYRRLVSRKIDASRRIYEWSKSKLMKWWFRRVQNAQARIASFVHGAYLRKKHRERTEAATVVQRNYRRHLLALRMREWGEAATRIQAFRRSVLARRRVGPAVASFTKVQNKWRARLRNRRLAVLDEAACRIQGFFRSTKSRRLLAHRVTVLRRINPFLRMVMARRRYLRAVSAAILLQRNFRLWRIEKRVPTSTMGVIWTADEITNAALAIQRTWFVHRQRLRNRRREGAAVRIQAVGRGYVERRRHKERVIAALGLQALRQLLVVRDERERKDAAAAMIQNWHAMLHERALLLRKRRAAVVIQAMMRRVLVVHRNEERRLAARIIQFAVRTRLNRGYVHRAAAAAKVIGAAAKRYLSIVRLERSLVAPQVVWASQMRQVRAEMNVCRTHEAAITIQAAWKLYLEGKYLRIIRDDAAITVQTAWRRVRLQNRYARQVEAAVVIQRALRRAVARHRLALADRGVNSIQARHRGSVFQKDYADKLRAASSIALAWRNYAGRQMMGRRTASIVFAQSLVRRFNAKLNSERRRAATRTIQHMARQWLIRRDLERCKRLVNMVARHIRGRISRRKEKVRKEAATSIQRYYLRWRYRAWMPRLRFAVILLQRRFRMANDIRMLLAGPKYKQIFMAVTIIERFWKYVLFRREQIRRIVMRVQGVYRKFAYRRAFLAAKRAAVVLQAERRRVIAQRSFQHKRDAAITIQCWVRCLRSMVERSKRVDAAYRLQAALRAYDARMAVMRKYQEEEKRKAEERRVAEEEENKRKFVLVSSLQFMWQNRMRKRLVAQRTAYVVKIQSWFRGLRSRWEQRQLLAAAAVINRNVRMMLGRRNLERRREEVEMEMELLEAMEAAKWHYGRKRKTVKEVAESLLIERRINKAVGKRPDIEDDEDVEYQVLDATPELDMRPIQFTTAAGDDLLSPISRHRRKGTVVRGRRKLNVVAIAPPSESDRDESFAARAESTIRRHGSPPRHTLLFKEDTPAEPSAPIDSPFSGRSIRSNGVMFKVAVTNTVELSKEERLTPFGFLNDENRPHLRLRRRTIKATQTFNKWLRHAKEKPVDNYETGLSMFMDPGRAKHRLMKEAVDKVASRRHASPSRPTSPRLRPVAEETSVPQMGLDDSAERLPAIQDESGDPGQPDPAPGAQSEGVAAAGGKVKLVVREPNVVERMKQEEKEAAGTTGEGHEPEPQDE